MVEASGSATWAFALLALGLTLGTCWLACRPLLRAGPAGEAPSISRWTAIWLSTAVVAGLSLSYLKVGQWEALGTGPGSVQATPTLAATPQDIPGLIAYLRRAPGDVASWKQLAQQCEQAGMLTEAVSAYRSWARLTPGDADTLSQYAVTLAMSKGQTLAGEPEALIARALKLSPRHKTALGLAGEAAMERRDDKAALGYFKRLLAVLPEGAPQREPLQERVAALTQRVGH